MSSKQREALSEIIDLISKWRTDGVMEHWQYSQLFDVADAALAEPLRNCDVGSCEDQAERYMNFCRNYPKCTGCPCVGRVKYNKCEFAWMQMPYEEVK